MEPNRHRQWMEFALVCKDFWDRCEVQEQLLAACGGAEDIAWAVNYHHGTEALEWMDGRIPFLGRLSPNELIRRGKADRVRECLWSTP